MFEGSTSFMTLTILILALILLVFVMKYAAQMLQARAQAERETRADTRLTSLENSTGHLDRRVAHLEALLREVE